MAEAVDPQTIASPEFNRTKDSVMATSVIGAHALEHMYGRAFLVLIPQIYIALGLAPILVKMLIAKIKELKERYNLTVLMAEQNFNQAIKIADRGYIIVHGQIEFEGKTAQDLENNDMIKQYYLGV